MATTISITISDADAPRLMSALCGNFNISYNHPTLIDANGVPLTPTGPLAKTVLVALLKYIVVQYETEHTAITPPDMT